MSDLTPYQLLSSMVAVTCLIDLAILYIIGRFSRVGRDK